jgi:hypothetical protein
MSPAFLMLAAALAMAAPAASLIGKPGCQTRCGDVDIPYPFGIGTASTGGANCSLPGFEISCGSRTTGSGSAVVGPVLAGTDIAVLNLSVMPRPQARVLLPVAWQCFNSTGDSTGYSYGTVRFNPDGVYRISDTDNELFVLGWRLQHPDVHQQRAARPLPLHFLHRLHGLLQRLRQRQGRRVRRRRLLPRQHPAGPHRQLDAVREH